jgi:hypothetical protein
MWCLSGGFRRIRITLCLALLGMGIVGCRSWIRPGSDVPQSLNATSPVERKSAILLPGADYRLLTVRGGPDFRQSDGKVYPGQDILCSEPSPDWAIAFGTAFAGAASGGASGGPSGSISGSANTTEAVTAALGRTAGVVALRDGLYSACQAYANQVLGKDAYSLILSQYGNLLLALASGSGGGGAGGSAGSAPTASATPPGVAVSVSTGSTSGSAKPSAQPTSSNAPQGENPQVAVLQQQAVQAMLVSCLSYNDRSIPHAVNALLEKNCGPFFDQLDEALPNLLKPTGETNQPPTGSKQTATATKRVQGGAKSPSANTVAIKDLQQLLLQDGDYQGPINGVPDAEIQAAYSKYLAKHPTGVAQGKPPTQALPPGRK